MAYSLYRCWRGYYARIVCNIGTCVYEYYYYVVYWATTIRSIITVAESKLFRLYLLFCRYKDATALHYYIIYNIYDIPHMHVCVYYSNWSAAVAMMIEWFQIINLQSKIERLIRITYTIIWMARIVRQKDLSIKLKMRPILHRWVIKHLFVRISGAYYCYYNTIVLLLYTLPNPTSRRRVRILFTRSSTRKTYQ